LNYPYIPKQGDYYLSTHDHRFIWIDKTGWMANYVGELNRFDTSKSQPVLVVSSTGYSSGYNPMGYYESSNDTVWRMLKDSRGVSDIELYPWAWMTTYEYPKTYTGTFWFTPFPIAKGYSRSSSGPTYQLLGTFITAARFGSTMGAMNEWANGDIITLGNARWWAVGGTAGTQYWCLIKEE